jgi:hypothetical protein
MTKLYIYPYSSGSESAKLLAERLGAKRIKLQNSEYVHTPDNLVINWGNSNCPYTEGTLNQGAAIKQTVDKLRFFRLMMQKGLSGYLPTYYTNAEDIPDEAFPIFCRTTTTGLDGAGIVIADSRSNLVSASLYTSFIKDSTEYRVTLFRGEVTDIQTKLPRVGENAHPMIRTFGNGWGFQRKAVADSIQTKIVQASKSALDAAGLDFGGVDVIFAGGRAYILEVNTAMGLEGDALDRFAKAVEYYVQSIQPVAPVAPPSLLESISSPTQGIDASILDAISAGDWKEVIKIAAGRLS